MERFYAPDLQSDSQEITLSPEESRHLGKSFRKSVGDTILLVNGKGLEAQCEVLQFSGSRCRTKIEKISNISQLPGALLQVAISTLRPKRLDWAVEKLTELGVGRIQLLTTRHTSLTVFKREHLQKVAIAALKQSKNAWLPQILAPVQFREWLPTALKSSDCLIAHLSPNAEQFIADAERPVTVMIGPEGGFSAEEIELASASGCRTMNLGSSVLRSETAAVCAATLILADFRRR